MSDIVIWECKRSKNSSSDKPAYSALTFRDLQFRFWTVEFWGGVLPGIICSYGEGYGFHSQWVSITMLPGIQCSLEQSVDLSFPNVNLTFQALHYFPKCSTFPKCITEMCHSFWMIEWLTVWRLMIKWFQLWKLNCGRPVRRICSITASDWLDIWERNVELETLSNWYCQHFVRGSIVIKTHCDWNPSPSP